MSIICPKFLLSELAMRIDVDLFTKLVQINRVKYCFDRKT